MLSGLRLRRATGYPYQFTLTGIFSVTVVSETGCMALKLLLLPRAIYQLILLIALGTISALAFAQPGYQQMLSRSDSVAHFSAFFTLSFLSQLALPIRWYWQVLLLLAYGGILELVQMSTPSRHASAGDLLVDLLAVSCYFVCCWRPVAALRARRTAR